MSGKQTVIAFVLMVVLAGCGQTSDQMPTLFPTLSTAPEAATATLASDSVPTTPPTLTPRNRPTLPPTYTPTEAPSTPTREVVTVMATLSIQSVEEAAEVCRSFGIDPQNSSDRFRIGDAPTVAWLPVENTRWYRLIIFDEGGLERHERLVEELRYTIPADVFLEPARYGWEVQPLDEYGVAICPSRGGMLDSRND